MTQTTVPEKDKGFISDPLLNVYFQTPEQKSSKETGKKISKKIWQNNYTTGDSLNFFRGRVVRWEQLKRWGYGTQDLTEFLDFMNVSDGNKAYSKIDMTPVRVGPQFVNTLVESMSKNKLYPFVSAVDDGSVKEKERRQLEALFRMREVQNIAQMQQKFGVQLEPANVYVPDDEIAAKVYFEQEDQLPKEVRFQQMLNASLVDCEFEKNLSPKGIHDLILYNAEFLKIEKHPKCGYIIKKCIPQSMIYNFVVNDTGEHELGYIGELSNLKIRDLRAQYGKSKENPKGLSEEQIFNICKNYATRKNIANFPWQWSNQYNYDMVRPWDDFSIQVFDFYINCGEPEYFVGKTDEYGKEIIKEKKGKPSPTSENARIIRKEKNSWYHGVYATDADEMLYWGDPEIVVNDYLDTHVSLCPYSMVIPFNNGDYVPSLFERIMEPLKEYQLTKLKRKQLIAKVKPSGIRIDTYSAQNIDLGNGNTIAWEEVMRIHDQTGNEVWNSRGINPNQRELPPLSNTVTDVTVQKIIELTNVLAGITQEIRSLIGVPLYRDGSDVPDRTPAKLAEAQTSSSFSVTDFIQRAHLQVWEDALNKLCILRWNDIVTDRKESANDLINTKFKVKVKLKITEYERQLLEANIQVWSKTIDGNGNPLLSPKDAFRIRRIEDLTLAEMYLASVIEENKRKAEEDKAKREQANIMSQQQSLLTKAKEDQKLKADQLKMEGDLEKIRSKEKMSQIALESLLQIFVNQSTPAAEGQPAKPAADVPAPLKPLFDLVMQNVAIPLFQENKEMKEEAQEAQIQETMENIQIQQQMNQGGAPPPEQPMV